MKDLDRRFARLEDKQAGGGRMVTVIVPCAEGLDDGEASHKTRAALAEAGIEPGPRDLVVSILRFSETGPARAGTPVSLLGR